MTFDKWFHKEYEPADLQIKQYAERKEGLHIPATCYLEDLKKAFEAGLHADVHIDNSKVIAELEEKLANADYQLEGRDNEIDELKEQNTNLQTMLKAEREVRCNEDYLKRVTELEAQIEKLIDFVISKTECCDVCPITDTCINSEGTCPYAGILAKGEEEVTREWLMQFISKEIKEK